MSSTLLIVLLAWVLMVPAVLALGRLLGRVSTPRVTLSEVPVEAPAEDNVVALVPRPRNGLDEAPLRKAS